MLFVRLVAMALMLFAGVGFGLYGLADPMDFPKAVSVACLIAALGLMFWDYIENGE